MLADCVHGNSGGGREIHPDAIFIPILCDFS